MNRTDIANSVAETMGISKVQSHELVKKVFSTVRDALEGGDNVQIADFGVFKIKETAERNGRNPKTGEALVIPAKKAVKFSATRELKNL